MILFVLKNEKTVCILFVVVKETETQRLVLKKSKLRQPENRILTTISSPKWRDKGDGKTPKMIFIIYAVAKYYQVDAKERILWEGQASYTRMEETRNVVAHRILALKYERGKNNWETQTQTGRQLHFILWCGLCLAQYTSILVKQ